MHCLHCSMPVNLLDLFSNDQHALRAKAADLFGFVKTIEPLLLLLLGPSPD